MTFAIGCTVTARSILDNLGSNCLIMRVSFYFRLVMAATYVVFLFRYGL